MSNIHKQIRFVKPMVHRYKQKRMSFQMFLLVNKDRWKYKHVMRILRSISHLYKTILLLL